MSLFYADDGLILAEDEQETRKSIQYVKQIAEQCGLTINKTKSNIIIIIYNYNNKGRMINDIEEIEVTDEINYLGTIITNKRECFKKQKKKILKKTKRFRSMTPTVTARGCNRILLGKTFYKGVVLPTTMYNTEIMYFTDIEVEKIQKEENKLYRYLLNAPVHTSIAAIRGEIGTSCQKTRMIKSKIHYLKHLLTNNQLLKELFLDDYNKNS